MDDREDLRHWTPRLRPGQAEIRGSHVVLEPLDWKRHGISINAAIGGATHAELWRYIPFGPFDAQEDFETIFEFNRGSEGWETLAIVDIKSSEALGMFSFMAIEESHGSVEIGCVVFGPAMQKTSQATEALYLMAKHIFDDLGYRRYEWKCDHANVGSKNAALRFGFQSEGVFRQHRIVKGLNRDTAWYSITDQDWTRLRIALEDWLAPTNFDNDGQQRKSLADIRDGHSPNSTGS